MQELAVGQAITNDTQGSIVTVKVEDYICVNEIKFFINLNFLRN
jgi:hypothetical protein